MRDLAEQVVCDEAPNYRQCTTNQGGYQGHQLLQVRVLYQETAPESCRCTRKKQDARFDGR
ncbi:MAG: hypothetical protein FJ291_02485 [Planctomycetes bacterium]|nr:hypothetical protein [Planctomycetota bacterium]